MAMRAAGGAQIGHVGIIMDGNGRWATKRGLPRTAGHEEGLKTVKRLVAEAADQGIKYLTLYTFSTENWKRSETEVGFLMNLIVAHLRKEFAFYKEHHIRIRHIGDLAGLPSVVQGEITRAIEETASFDGLTVVLAINYGGRDEILRAAQKYHSAASRLSPENTAFPTLESCLDLSELPDLDLLIRTGGEKRLSNFLLWQSAYAELAFCDTLFPDYTEEHFRADLADFAHRQRRFGGVTET
jgi:undecaprenyl diphosphate synthase